MTVARYFGEEVRRFSRTYPWVYLAYLTLLLAITVRNNGNFPASIFVITSLHFVADVFIMMMISAYARQEGSQGAYFQLTSTSIFLLLKLYAGFNDGEWHYLWADPIYVLAAFRNYSVEIRHRDIKFVNTYTMALLSLLIVFGILAPHGVITSRAVAIQTGGIFLFAVALSTIGNERLRYGLGVVALIAMVTGSGWKSFSGYQSGGLVGLEISYFFLPLTVLIFYFRNWSQFLRPNHSN